MNWAVQGGESRERDYHCKSDFGGLIQGPKGGELQMFDSKGGMLQLSLLS